MRRQTLIGKSKSLRDKNTHATYPKLTLLSRPSYHTKPYTRTIECLLANYLSSNFEKVFIHKSSAADEIKAIQTVCDWAAHHDNRHTLWLCRSSEQVGIFHFAILIAHFGVGKRFAGVSLLFFNVFPPRFDAWVFLFLHISFYFGWIFCVCSFRCFGFNLMFLFLFVVSAFCHLLNFEYF